MARKMRDIIRRKFIDVYWDDELEEPCWIARRVNIMKDGSWMVVDSDCYFDKKTEAIQCAKKWAKKAKLPLEIMER